MAVCFSGVRPVYPSCQRLHDLLPSVSPSACMCVSGGSLTASCTHNMLRESLASQDREGSEKTISTLTLPCYHALHACVFVCVKGIRDNGLVCVCACKADRIKYSRGEGRGDSEGFHISLRQQFTRVNTHTHTGAHTLPGHLVHSSFTN